ncbi:MAG TPA: hypothetical protein VIC84_03160 [Blastocatellia bacterium]
MNSLDIDYSLHKSNRSPARVSRFTQTTPARLKTALGASWVLTGALCIVVLSGWAQRGRAAKTLGVDAAPSVVAAHKIRIHIETLDADLANELLGRPGEMAGYVADFDKNRVEISEQIIAASKNITYGDAELIPIQKIEDGLGRYLMAAQAARDAHARGDLASVLNEYRRSYALLEKELAPAAKELNAANDGVLQATYEAQKSASLQTFLLALAVGGALALLLAVTQIYVTRSFRRRLNPALALATVVSALFIAYSLSRFVSHSQHMDGVKQDSYESVAALLDARADVYEANAAESRWLLDPQARAEHERTFREYTAKLVSLSGGQTFEKAYAIAQRRNALMADRMKKGDDPVAASLHTRSEHPLDGMDGALKKALDNITFPDTDPLKDEPTQSAETLRTFGVYYGLDARVRELELAGRHAEAVRFCLSMKEGESNWAFFNFDKSLGNWIKLNEEWMRRYTEAAFADVAGLQYAAPIVSVLVAALAFFGLRSRIREYSI